MRRHPRFTVLFLLAAIPSAMVWSELVLFNFDIEEPVEWDMRLTARATMDIKDLLAVIGHGVTVSSVEAREFDKGYAAAYFWDRRVAVDARFEFAEETLLYVMGHECAHAMFRQGGFLAEDLSIERYQHHVHEVAADVVGAHLAGRVVSRRGGDGLSLTNNLVEESRIKSRFYAIGPFAIKKHIRTEWDGNVRTSLGGVNWTARRYGAEPLINEIDRICRDHEDLWEAVRAIANELHNVGAKTARMYSPPDDWRP
jgi:hypothetical protein